MSLKRTIKQIPGVLDLYNKVSNRFRGSSLSDFRFHYVALLRGVTQAVGA